MTAKNCEESKITKKYKKMTKALCDVLSDFGLISYLPVNIEGIQTYTCIHTVSLFCRVNVGAPSLGFHVTADIV